MKRLSFIVALLVIATGAFAQFAQSGAVQSNAPANTNSRNFFSKMATDNYGRLYIGYNPISVDWEENAKEQKKMFPMKNGLSLGYMHANNIVKSLPLYVEYGANVAWTFGKYNDKKSDDGYSSKTEIKLNMFSINVPVNVAFRFSFANNDFSVTPYLGLNFRINLAGTCKQTTISEEDNEYDNEYDGEYYGEYDGEYDDEYYGESYKSTTIVKYKLFSSDEINPNDNDAWDIKESENEVTREATTGMGDRAFKRFQVGFNVGVAVNYKKLHLGFGYVADFNKLANDDNEFACRLGVPTISLGVAF